MYGYSNIGMMPAGSNSKSMNVFNQSRIGKYTEPSQIDCEKETDSKNRSQDDEKILSNISRNSEKKIHFDKTVLSYTVNDKSMI